MTEKKWDVLCMGRAAVDLYADQIGAELEDASSFSKYIGGCPANVAVGCARLGLKSAMLTRVGPEAMGRFVRKTLEEEGVDTRLVHTDPDRLTGLVLLGVAPPDHFPLIFYRERCADMALCHSDYSKADIAASRALLITGTHFSQPGAAVASTYAAQLAHELQTAIVLDIDYRPVLWRATGIEDGESRYAETLAVSEALAPVLPQCSIIVGTEEEFRIAAGQDSLNKAIAFLRSVTEATLVLKRGPGGCAVFISGKDEGIECGGFPVEVSNVLGAGDAFLSGLLKGWLSGKSWDVSAAWANACGALVVTRHACAPAMPYWQELREFVASRGDPSVVEALHQQLGRKAPAKLPLSVLAFDHEQAFEDSLPFGTQRIVRAKELIFEALLRAQRGGLDGQQGLIIDEHYGSEVLRRCEGEGLWIGRCWRSALLEYGDPVPELDPGLVLRHWPRHHVIKVLWRASPEVLAEQLWALQNLQRASELWGHQLLIEIVRSEEESELTLEDIRHCYGAGVTPSWWKLPAYQAKEFWVALRKELMYADPHCLGVLLLGQGLPEVELLSSFESLVDLPLVKGVAVGRTVWSEALDLWANEDIDDAEFVDSVAEGFESLVNGFTTARTG